MNGGIDIEARHRKEDDRGEEEKRRAGGAFFLPKNPPKTRAESDEDHSHGEKDDAGPHPGDEEEAGGKGSEDGAEGGEGIDLSDDIACLFQIVEGQFDDDGRDHPEKTGGDEKDDGGDEKDPNHQAGLELGCSDQVGQRRNGKVPPSRKERGASRGWRAGDTGPQSVLPDRLRC